MPAAVIEMSSPIFLRTDESSDGERNTVFSESDCMPANSPPFTLVYRITTLIALGETFAALDLNDLSRPIIQDEAWLTLRLLPTIQSHQTMRECSCSLIFA